MCLQRSWMSPSPESAHLSRHMEHSAGEEASTPSLSSASCSSDASLGNTVMGIHSSALMMTAPSSTLLATTGSLGWKQLVRLPSMLSEEVDTPASVVRVSPAQNDSEGHVFCLQWRKHSMCRCRFSILSDYVQEVQYDALRVDCTDLLPDRSTLLSLWRSLSLAWWTASGSRPWSDMLRWSLVLEDMPAACSAMFPTDPRGLAAASLWCPGTWSWPWFYRVGIRTLEDMCITGYDFILFLKGNGKMPNALICALKLIMLHVCSQGRVWLFGDLCHQQTSSLQRKYEFMHKK